MTSGSASISVGLGEPIGVSPSVESKKVREGDSGMMNSASIPDWLSLVVSFASLVISLLGALHKFLVPPRLKWQKPLVFSVDDERTETKHRHRPVIAIALTIHNAGAQPGTVWDTAAVVTRLSDPNGRASFQARKFGSDLRYVTVFEMEKRARPTTAIVVDGHHTKTVVVQFEQRSSNQWRWRPGTYVARVYSLGNGGQWTEKTSFEFILTDESMDGQSQPTRVTPCQRWTREVLVRRDALMEQLHWRKKSAFRRF
ncbi:MAG TPA: hypothetical protein DDZ84_11235 [Firmicutes bacterium]|nr:hypothetical protein [Bacillota bacterium]